MFVVNLIKLIQNDNLSELLRVYAITHVVETGLILVGQVG